MLPFFTFRFISVKTFNIKKQRCVLMVLVLVIYNNPDSSIISIYYFLSLFLLFLGHDSRAHDELPSSGKQQREVSSESLLPCSTSILTAFRTEMTALLQTRRLMKVRMQSFSGTLL